MSVSSPTATPAERTRHAGRYEIRERIGEGAMGVVHAGYDPQLQRKLAVKFVVPRQDDARGRERLLREAQALARVNHANVVSVYDAGEADDGRVFIAMDYVAGVTLSEWLVRAPRTWREVVRIFVEAGRGLAAAHAAGLVHRDFKPQNVLVDEGGVARVVDFGLVTGLEDMPTEPDEGAQAERAEAFADRARGGGEGTLVDDTLTRAGAIAGTPAYMAPEQSAGKNADARSDQFSFCVALFEGLSGRRPYDAPSASALLETGAHELIGPRSRGSKLPPRVHAAIRRGLSPDPEARWPSMDELLDELERARFNVSPWSVLSLAAAVVIALVSLINVDRIRAWWEPVTVSVPVTEAQIVEPMTAQTSPEGEVYVTSTVANKGRLEVRAELPSTGRYYLYALVWEATLGGARGDADSFFVYVDDGDERLFHFGCENENMPDHVIDGNWAWQPVLHMANSDSDCEIESGLSWDLDAGPHRIVFRNREDADSPQTAARLARVVITNQASWRPPG